MNLCGECRADTRIRTQEGGPARLCGHQAHLSGHAYCHGCADAKNACARCGKGLEPDEEDPPHIIRGID